MMEIKSKTALQILNEYSDGLISSGITSDEYMVKIPLKMWTMIHKTFEEQLSIEDAYRDGYNKGYREGRLNRHEIPFVMPIDYFEYRNYEIQIFSFFIFVFLIG